MAKTKWKAKKENPFNVVLDFVDTTDTVFTKLTGKSIAEWLKEFQQQPGELPPGERVTAQQPVMPLADAYAVLGLPQTATMKEVKRNYRNLAVIFHPDKGGYKEAMVLLNRAYERITKGKSD